MVDIFEELKKDNPKIPLVDLRVFANALATYWEASENLRANGVVCSHPRTGAPLENPYLKVQAAQAPILARFRAVRSDRVLRLLSGETGETGAQTNSKPARKKKTENL